MRFAITFALFVVFALPAVGADKDKSKKGQMDEDVKKATAKALEWLASKQKANRFWGDTR